MGQLFQQVMSCNDVEGLKSLHHESAGLECADKEAEALLDLGSNVNDYHTDCNDGTSLHHPANTGLKNTDKLLSHGANPLLLNDDFQRHLDVARANGYSDVVRAIESGICLFSGWMREFYCPSLVEMFSPQLLSRRVWVVIVPTKSRNPSKPLKLELVVYASLQDAKPMMVIPLWKANLEESRSDQSDASVIIVDISSKPKKQRKRGYISHARRWAQVDRQMRLKLASATKGDIKQLNLFCEACKGIPQPMFLKTTEKIISNELRPSVPVRVEVEDSSVLFPSFPSADYESKEGVGRSGVCVICVDASSEAACVPCGHVAGCITCLKEIKNKKMGCPICRASIDQVIKLYHV